MKILAEREVEPGLFEGYTENYTPARVAGTKLGGCIVEAEVTMACDGYVLCRAL